MDMQDYEKTQATLQLMQELAKGRKSGEEKGWLTLAEVEKSLELLEQKKQPYTVLSSAGCFFLVQFVAAFPGLKPEERRHKYLC